MHPDSTESISPIPTLIGVIRRAIPILASGSIVTLFAILLATALAPPLKAQVNVQDPAILQVHVVEGDGAVYAVGSRATKGISIQVTDETGKPVDDATISFRLPDIGPTGTFASGSRTEIATTRADGRAAAWGMQWNRSPGLLEIRITAAKGQTRAGILCAQYLTDAPDAATSKAMGGSHGLGGNHKWLWIAAAVAGAAAGAVAAVALGGKAPASTASTAAVTIGAPTITLGHP
jgi:hypothetical protein